MGKRAAAAAVLFVAGIFPAAATVRIHDDRGGQIGVYLDRFHALRRSGERVAIDGVCASACTMLLGAIPERRICVTPRAVLEFHSAWNPTPAGSQVISSAGNRILWSTYPAKIRNWIVQHGGLGTRIIYLSGADLAAMYPACR
ncbi:MAG TPA: hypothetical protein VME41_03825 [Stellaceae bacterium]|nr:hypothetical protein [Stellaceae bacterium]